jgi:O-antigen/teichoic acid export membrane protein
LKINILANYLGTLFSIFAIYFFIPYYIKYLGTEGYGLIMFSTTLQAIIFLLDAGFSSSVRRELSIGVKNEHFVEKAASFVKTLELFYGIIFLVLILLITFSANAIADNWFNFKDLSHTEVKNALILMVIISVFQMQSSLYDGALQALEFQVLSNVVKTLSTVFRSGVVIFIIMYYPSPVIFLFWQLIIIIFFTIVQRFLFFKKLYSYVKNVKNYGQRGFILLKNSLEISLLFLAISIFSALNLQIDKIIISKLLPIANIGYYTTVYTMGQVLVSISGPISSALAPRLIRMFSLNDFGMVKTLFHKFAKFNVILTTSLGITILMNSLNIISIWTNNPDFTSHANPLVPFMVVAGLCFSAQIIPYNLAVANADLKPTLMTCTFNLILSLPAYYWATLQYGMKGTSAVWMVSNIGMMFFNVFFYLRKSLPNSYLKWLLHDFLIPLVIGASITTIVSMLKPSFSNKFFDLISIGFVFILSFLSTLVIFFLSDLKNMFKSLNFINKYI